MSQRIEYGPAREAVVYYEVVVVWYLAFEIEDPNFKPEYIPRDLIEDLEQQQRRQIANSLPDSDPGRKWLILNFFPDGL